VGCAGYIYIGAVVDFEKVEIFREYSAGRDSGGKKITKKGRRRLGLVGGWVGYGVQAIYREMQWILKKLKCFNFF
jgi:hypothetical protein